MRHIIKDTDAHNKALLAKEAADSKARLEGLEHADELKRRKTNPDTRDIRRRQMGDIMSILGGRPRKDTRNEQTVVNSRESRRKDDKGRDIGKELKSSSRREKDLFMDEKERRRSHGRLSRNDHKDDGTERRSRTSDSRRNRRRDYDDYSSNEERERRHHKSRRHRSKSPRRSRRRSRSPADPKTRHRHRSPLRAAKTPEKDAAKKNEDDDSDPLEDLIGPAPPPKVRGRGTMSGSTGMDRRFSESYDPTVDVVMEDDDKQGGNWDDALEAFRDRQKLQQNQEQRLRAAGFADEQILKVNNSAKEKSEADVVWTKAGERREWDRGKSEESEEVLRGILSEDS